MKIKMKGNTFKKLKAIDPDILAQLDSKLTLGDTAMDCARWLQNDHKLFLESDISALKKQLERYRGSELRDKTIERIAVVQKKAEVATIARRLNAMEELDVLAQQQRARLDKLLAKEALLPDGILLKDATREIAMLKDLLVDLGRMQLETGLMPRAARTFKGSLTGPDGMVSQFEWTEEQEQLYRELEGMVVDAQ